MNALITLKAKERMIVEVQAAKIAELSKKESEKS